MNPAILTKTAATSGSLSSTRIVRRGTSLALLLVFATIIVGCRAGSASGRASAAIQRPRVPVTAARVRRDDLNIYLTALGSVTAFNTVTVKSRVDGQLVTVAFKEGQLVHRGDLLAQIDPRPFEAQLEQARGQLNRDVASLQNARLDLNRDQILYAHGAISQQQRDTQAAAVKQDEGAVTSDRANIQTANLQLTYSRINAPITGRIGLRLVDQGNIIHATDAQGLAVITQLQPIALLFSIPEDDLPQVSSGMRTGRQLPVDAYDRDMKVKLATGELATFDSQIDQNTGTIRLKAVFPNDDDALFPNQFVNARLMVDTRHDATLISAAAVQKSPQGSFVYVVKPDMTVQVRNVKVDVTQGDVVSIDSGVAPGELVVIDGVDKLQQGTKVDVQLASNSVRRPTP